MDKLSRSQMVANNKLFKLEVPEGYKELSEEEVSKLMPGVKYICCYRDDDTQRFISVTSAKMPEDNKYGVEDLLSEYMNAYSRTVPGFSSANTAVKVINGKQFGGIQYNSTTLDLDLFNYTFITLDDDCQVVVTMQSRLQDFVGAQPEFLKIIDSARITAADN